MNLAIISAILITTTSVITTTTVYDFKIQGLNGGIIDFSQYQGKKILIVNTASECGYTPQYEQLQKLYEQYKDKLVVVGVPSNDFGKQEPGTDEEIVEFCRKEYGITFPMTTKVKVKGEDKHPLYRWLTTKAENGYEDSKVKWNFQKYLIDEEGHLICYFKTSIKPLSEEIISAIEK